jgi:peptidoglycan/LPS O-acetylase OafA/YrhL
MQDITIIYLKISMREKFQKLWQYLWSQDSTTLNSSRSDILEVVKALTILWIAWYHIDQLMLPANHEVWSIRTLASFGFAGVNVFLLLSGLALTLSITKVYINSAKSWISIPWGKFFIRRILRIYPLYIFCHILFFITGYLAGKYTDMPLDLGFLLSITGLRVFFPQYFWYGPDAFWFVGLIIQLYLLFPILFLLLVKLKKIKFLVMVFMLCAVSRFITSNSEAKYVLMLGLSTNHLAEFCMGMFIGSALLKKESTIFQINLKRKVIFIYLFLSVMFGIFLYYQPISLIWTLCSDLVLALISLLCLISIALSIKCVSLIYKFLIILGRISYGFYLLHSPPIRPVFAGLKTFGLHDFWLLTTLYLLSIIILSFVLTYIENLIFSSR